MAAHPSIVELGAEAFQALAAGRGSWRQYPAYSREAAVRVGARVRFLAVERGGVPFALASVRYRPLPLGLGASALLSHGPILLSKEPHDRDAALDALARYAAGEGWELRCDPDPLWALRGEHPASGGGYRTIVLDTSAPLEDIRKGFDGKWRRSLQAGEKAALAVEVSAEPAAILRAQELLAELMQRKTFAVPQDADFFARVAGRAQGNEEILAHSVFHEGRLVSIHIGAFAGEMAVYLLGATTPEGRTLNASYVAQWSVIETAKARGLAFYDLGGIDPVENPDVYRFKKRMGGRELAMDPIFTLSCQGLRARAAGTARRLATRLRT